MAFVTRNAVLALIKEDVEGQLKEPQAGTDFTVLNEGFSVEGTLETVESVELIADIGNSKSFSTKEAPTASVPKYFKHSGIEGQAPDYGVLIESSMGEEIVAGVEYSTIAGSEAGDASTQAFLQMDTGEAAFFSQGQTVLIKHAGSPYEMRNIDRVDTGLDRLYLNFNLNVAPSAGTALGLAVLYTPKGTGHPTFSLHQYQAGDNTSGFKQAIAGCRTSGFTVNFPVNDLAGIDFTVEGIEYFFDHITLEATSQFIDFTDDGGTKSATLDAKAYKHPEDLAASIASRMTAASSNTISCIYSGSKFILSSDGATFELNWSTGANAANTAGTKLGFDTASDDTGLTTYESDNAQTWGPDFTPAYDDQTPTVVKSNELLIGTFDKNICRSGSNVSLTIGTPKTDVEDFCAASGVSESVINERTAELTATLIFKKDEIDTFYALLQNSDLSLAFNHGPKAAGNWEAGKCTNVYMQKATITQSLISDTDGFVSVEITANGFITTDKKDIYVNFS